MDMIGKFSVEDFDAIGKRLAEMRAERMGTGLLTLMACDDAVFYVSPPVKSVDILATTRESPGWDIGA